METEYVREPEQPLATNLTDDEPTVLGLGIEDLIVDVHYLRRDLWHRGYRPIAVYGPDSAVDHAGKRPKGNNWLNRARQETPEAVTTKPEADALNTAILCDGLVAVDVDVDDLMAAAAVKAAIVGTLGIAPTRTRKHSPRALLLYRAADGVFESRKVKGPDGLVEFLGQGHPFVAYGTHPSGVPLVWEHGCPADISLQDLPAVNEEQIKTLIGKLQGIVGYGESADAGDTVRHRARSTLGPLADSLDVVAALCAIPNNRPQDWEHWSHIGMATYAATAGSSVGYAAWLAWSEKHQAHDAANCKKRWQEFEASPPTRVGAGTLFHLAEQAQQGWAKPSGSVGWKSTSAPMFKIVTASQLLTLNLPPRATVLDPWLPEKGLAMVYGLRGVGKTFLVQGAAVAIATGGNFLGWQAPQPRRVLIIDGEMPATALRERLATHNQPLPEHLSLLAADMQERDLDLSEPKHQAQLEPYLAGADVIFVDNISTLTRGGRENEAESWLPVQEWALRQRRAGRAVVFVHHAGKGGQQRGTSRKEDVLDTVIALRKPADYQPEEGARFELHYEKARGFLGKDARTFEASLENEQWVTHDLANVMLERVVESTLAGASARDIAEELNTSKSTVHRLQQQARDAGKLPAAAPKKSKI